MTIFLWVVGSLVGLYTLYLAARYVLPALFDCLFAIIGAILD